MTKFIAYASLAVLNIAIAFGNYWFTFGLWPKSWLSFVGFGFASIVSIALGLIIQQENE